MVDRCNENDCFIRDMFDDCSRCYKSKAEVVKQELESLAERVVGDAITNEEFIIISDSIMHILEECEKERDLLLERLKHSETERFQPERVRINYDYIGDNKLWAGYIK